VLVLAYHSVSERWQDPLCVRPETFAGQVRALARRGYRGVTFTEAAAADVGGRAVAVTFDDAFATVMDARAVLDELGWPATVFVPTVAVETAAPMRWLVGDRWTQEQDTHLMPLSWQELTELQDAGWEIGSHSRTHRLLSSLVEDDAFEELAGSRRELEQHVGPCTSISYPWGEVVSSVIDLARSAGYTSGSGLVGGIDGEPLAVPRFAIAASDGELKYALKTSAAIWRVRGSIAWKAANSVRHRGDVPARATTGALAHSALVLDGSTGPGLAVMRSLGRAGWTVLAPVGSRAARSRYAAGTVELPDPVREPDAYAAHLADLVDRGELDVVVPCTDASLEAAWGVVGKRPRPRVLGGDARTVETALDKVRCLQAAEQHGFPVPAWSAPSSRTEALEALERIGLPCVAKPRRSFERRGQQLEHRRHMFVESPADLDQALSVRSAGELPILQEYVPGRALSVSAVVHDGEVVAAVARETFTFHPIAGGTSVWKRTVERGDVGVEQALGLLQVIGLEGLAEVEYQVGHDGVPRLMEIGARVHGWVPLAIAAGVDLPLLAARIAVGESVRPVPSYRAGVEMRWPAGELLRLRAVLGPRAALPPGVRRGQVLAGVWPPWRPGMRYDGVDVADPRPSLRWPAGRRRHGSP